MECSPDIPTKNFYDVSHQQRHPVEKWPVTTLVSVLIISGDWPRLVECIGGCAIEQFLRSIAQKINFHILAFAVLEGEYTVLLKW